MTHYQGEPRRGESMQAEAGRLATDCSLSLAQAPLRSLKHLKFLANELTGGKRLVLIDSVERFFCRKKGRMLR